MGSKNVTKRSVYLVVWFNSGCHVLLVYVHFKILLFGCFCYLSKYKEKVKTAVYSSGNRHTAAGNHMPCGVTQCYLPPDSGDFPAFTPTEGGTRFSDPGGMQG